MTNESLWRALATGEVDALARDRGRYKRIPGKPRCKSCLIPLGGPAAPLLRLVGRARSTKNPNYCNICETFVRTHPGGAEVTLSLVFADVRGSTTLAEGMTPAEFSRLMNRFYDVGNRVLIESDGFVDKLVGDEVIGLYLPLIGPEHPRNAILAARDLLIATGHEEPHGPWLPVGAGVHTGNAYFGAVGSTATVTDLTALGDAVNVAARLAQLAGTGEVLISEDAYTASDLDLGELDRAELALKGRTAATPVRILRLAGTEPAPAIVS